jgi:transposase
VFCGATRTDASCAVIVRWKVERTIAWLQNFRRVQVRYDRIFAVYQGFVHLACLIIVLRHL